MFLASFACGQWQANTYLVAATGESRCLVVDPGQGSAPGVNAILEQNQLVPAAVLATHGHFDHVADAASLCDQHQVPLMIHSADRWMLTDPMATLPISQAALAREVFPGDMREPARVELLDALGSIEIAGLNLGVALAPGHTEGSVIVSLEADETVVLTGDVVFAGSIGRTDLPGGDPAAMARTLATVIWPLADSSTLLPGHGSATTMAQERSTNPYLQPGFWRD